MRTLIQAAAGCLICWLVVGLGVGLVGAGCAAATYRYGESIEAVYSKRTLTARLPETIRVPAGMAALDEVLRDRGYTVLESSVTEDRGISVSRAPRYNTYPRLVVEMRQTATACVVTMRNEPFGDKDQVEQMMRVLVERLGL